MTGRRRKPGRMGSSIEEYRAWLVGWSYAPETVKNMLATAGDLGRWMDIRDVAPDRVDRCVIAEFRVACSAAGMRCAPGARGLDPLLDYLKYEGVLAESPAPASPVEVLVERYRRWLVAD